MNLETIVVLSCVRKLFFSLMGAALLLAGTANLAHAQRPPMTLSQPHGWTECANEGQWCKFPPGFVRDVAFGAGGRYAYMWAVQDAQFCANAQFWGDDPIPWAPKKCYYSNSPSRLSYGFFCAKQGDPCVVTGTATVWFGQGGRFFKKNVTAADGAKTTVKCDVATFGQPFDDADKYCVYTP